MPDLMQVVDFTRPDAICQQVVSSQLTSSSFIKFHQVCEHQTCCNLIFVDLVQVDEITCIKPACSSQLAASLLTTCNNRLAIIKPEQAMRTHPDIGLLIADLRVSGCVDLFCLFKLYCQPIHLIRISSPLR